MERLFYVEIIPVLDIIGQSKYTLLQQSLKRILFRKYKEYFGYIKNQTKRWKGKHGISCYTKSSTENKK
jgi:hypothetical protein